MSHSSTRREFLALTAASLIPARAATESHQATGVKVGEITPDSALIWTRRTKSSLRNVSGTRSEEHVTVPLETDPATLEGACTGTDGEMRVIVTSAAGKPVQATEWSPVNAQADFTRQFPIRNLQPDTAYKFTVETRASSKTDGSISGAFRTASPEDANAAVDFAMLSCQKYEKRDDNQGYFLYDAIRKFAPHFYLSVGDNVYYDSDYPVVNSTAIARYHWNRMYSLARVSECTRMVPGYWMKDDHDSYSNDDWPGYVDEKMLPFTWEQGLKVFPEQTPFPAGQPYRTFRWGRSLEVFLLEGRDFRMANNLPDGPTKTIWGKVQKEWIKHSVASSKAHWKIIVSPTPVVGPDRGNKHDNHANDAFTQEGNEIRKWVAENTKHDTFFFNGDRHWQYHSVDPATKVEEFSCGAASDAHASGSPGPDPEYHRFHRVLGGFIAVNVRPAGSTSRIVIEHRDVHGNKVYGQTREKKV
jgi:alkaline phosphatase D